MLVALSSVLVLVLVEDGLEVVDEEVDVEMEVVASLLVGVGASVVLVMGAPVLASPVVPVMGSAEQAPRVTRARTGRGRRMAASLARLPVRMQAWAPAWTRTIGYK